jgi:hypothetical protein
MSMLGEKKKGSFWNNLWAQYAVIAAVLIVLIVLAVKYIH